MTPAKLATANTTPVTVSDCERHRGNIYSRHVPKWIVLVAASILWGGLLLLGGYVFANHNGISVLKVEMKYLQRDVAKFDAKQDEHGVMLRSIDNAVNGGG